jgi:acyl dehydratase
MIMAEAPANAKTAYDFVPGQDIGVSGWVTIDQALLDKFSEATLDPDPMHVDPTWAATKGPFGHTVSFGFLTMSLLTHLMHDAVQTGWAVEPGTQGYYLNYGFDRLRLITPVPVGSRIRGKFRTLSRLIDEKARHVVKVAAEVEIEGVAKPALAAEWLTIWVPPPEAE